MCRVNASAVSASLSRGAAAVGEVSVCVVPELHRLGERGSNAAAGMAQGALCRPQALGRVCTIFFGILGNLRFSTMWRCNASERAGATVLTPCPDFEAFLRGGERSTRWI